MSTEQKALEAKAHLAAIIDSSDDAIISKNLEGIISSWNPSAERIFGYTAQEAIGQHISIVIPKERMDEEYVILGKVRQGEPVIHFETVRKRKDGKEVHVSLTVSPIKDDDGNIIGASKIAHDISDMKEAERASAYLAAIVESSDDVVISKQLDGTITSWNASAQRVFGYTADEMIGQHISKLIPEENLDEEYAIIGRIKAGERVEHFETIRKAKDGSLVNLSLTISPIRDKSGKIIGASKVARDVTEQKRLEAKLEEAARRKDEFLANISHELRTPMNAIIGLSNIISTHLPEGEPKKYAATLIQSAEDLMVLINNLLDFSKMENGLMVLESKEFDLPRMVDKVVKLLEVQAKEKGVEVRAAFKGPLNKFYMGDAFRINQVLTNLVGNALKFTQAGSVEINVRGEGKENGAQSIVFEVADTGIGVAEDKLDMIFDKFTQADASTTRKFGGSGLGLAIAKSFVEAMGGAIGARSRVGLGSTFWFSLPLKVSAQEAPLLATTPVAPRSKKNVLVVEDYEPNVMVVTALLDRFGYNYDVAYNGAGAVQCFREGEYDAILMDVQMDEMDGLESAMRIRVIEREKGRSRTPIIAMSAHVQQKDKDRCIEVGMDEFIAKPFDANVLDKTLKAFISKR